MFKYQGSGREVIMTWGHLQRKGGSTTRNYVLTPDAKSVSILIKMELLATFEMFSKHL